MGSVHMYPTCTSLPDGTCLVQVYFRIVGAYAPRMYPVVLARCTCTEWWPVHVHPACTIWYTCTGDHVPGMYLHALTQCMPGTRVLMTMYHACTYVYPSGASWVHVHALESVHVYPAYTWTVHVYPCTGTRRYTPGTRQSFFRVSISEGITQYFTSKLLKAVLVTYGLDIYVRILHFFTHRIFTHFRGQSWVYLGTRVLCPSTGRVQAGYRSGTGHQNL
jgi:hypothetical protein